MNVSELFCACKPCGITGMLYLRSYSAFHYARFSWLQLPHSFPYAFSTGDCPLLVLSLVLDKVNDKTDNAGQDANGDEEQHDLEFEKKNQQ
jgi:hypothetical protein